MVLLHIQILTKTQNPRQVDGTMHQPTRGQAFLMPSTDQEGT